MNTVETVDAQTYDLKYMRMRYPLMRKIQIRKIAQLLLVLVAAVGLKYFYSTASVNQLRWILAPTTFLVELISGTRFQFESHAGYMSSDHTFLIAASCAGVNFLLTAFLMLALGRLWKNRNARTSWAMIPVALLVAYLTTVITNTVRISTALSLRQLSSKINWLTPEQLHRVEGILIYFGFLLLLFVVSEQFAGGSAKPELGEKSNATLWIFPLFVYYATTLGMPLLNGAYRQGADFWQHSLFVLVIPLGFTVPVIIVQVLGKWNTGLSKNPLTLRLASASGTGLRKGLALAKRGRVGGRLKNC